MKRNIVIGTTSVLIILMVLYSVFATDHLEVSADTSSEEEIVEEVVASETIFVEVKGAVELPGVYEFESGVRVYQVFEKAGGLRADANVEYINQTRIVEDETLIVIMTSLEIEEAINQKELMVMEESKIYDVQPTSKDIIGYDECFANNKSQSETGKISINNASAEELMTLNGLGESKANAIIAYREDVGGFTTVEEIMNVSGIGESTFNQIKDAITL